MAVFNYAGQYAIRALRAARRQLAAASLSAIFISSADGRLSQRGPLRRAFRVARVKGSIPPGFDEQIKLLWAALNSYPRYVYKLQQWPVTSQIDCELGLTNAPVIATYSTPEISMLPRHQPAT